MRVAATCLVALLAAAQGGARASAVRVPSVGAGRARGLCGRALDTCGARAARSRQRLAAMTPQNQRLGVLRRSLTLACPRPQPPTASEIALEQQVRPRSPALAARRAAPVSGPNVRAHVSACAAHWPRPPCRADAAVQIHADMVTSQNDHNAAVAIKHNTNGWLQGAPLAAEQADVRASQTSLAQAEQLQLQLQQQLVRHAGCACTRVMRPLRRRASTAADAPSVHRAAPRPRLQQTSPPRLATSTPGTAGAQAFARAARRFSL